MGPAFRSGRLAFAALALLLAASSLLVLDRDARAQGAAIDVVMHRDKLYDVAIVGEKIWVVGFPGRILYSADAGKTWVGQEGGGAKALFSVHFADESTGWAVGRDGLILATKDGGAHWAPQKGPKDVHLFDLSFIDAKVGWASGFFGSVIGTTDGGDTWNLLRYSDIEGEDPSLNGIDFPTATSGWTVGEFGTVLHSKDAGKTWEKQDAGVFRMFFDVAFTDDKQGYAVGGHGQMVKTEDGGESWEEIRTGVEDNLLALDVLADKVWITGLNGIYLEGPVGAPKPRFLDTYVWLNGVQMTSGGFGAAVGREGTILVTKDQGTSWVQLKIK